MAKTNLQPGKINTQWLQGLSEKEAETFKKSVLGSKIVLDKLVEICYNIGSNDKKMREKDYDCPSWSHKQAHLNGKAEMLEQIISIISLPEEQ